ncbi:PREDICTED: nucleolar protein 58 isoform X2 [Gavialis gangeticus]|uniref:nucleolar protein 58 isoform X1 n=1 Tax=Gavialis gangeticus TaxID=94835 RepID=UPI00092EF142|nr:PREDICTED: nucleolar protein 58 isoform X1 [Gavialis gangeticus]XP_019379052.1 PREDICTED: nucleolar protein 58 isoform X2 [Gavialis gangeticus]
MLVLFETAAGYAIFKVLDEKKLQEVDSLWKEFETPEKANKIVKLKHFEKFQDTTEALAASTALVEGKLSKNLKKILKKIVAKDAHEQLAIADAKLGGVIKDKLNLSCIHSPMVTELMRGIRSQVEGLITGLPSREMAAMCLGLAHSLSRYKLKFSPDKVDTMIVQAISLLDDLDKELNNYIMRCREWYGWHFPELGKIITDNLTYCKCVQKVGDRKNFSSSDLSDILPEEIEVDVKAAAEISMGTEVSEEDISNILHLCEQVIEISEYRTQLYDYLKNRMMAIAPNLTVMVGELVGARLIAHAGSLLNLAKHPASTVQILGAEKALFRALKSKRDTPKFGLIYHASLVGQTTPKNKGKISRMLAAKTALSIRYDALGEDSSAELGAENRLKVETRMRQLEEKGIRRISGTGKALARADRYQHKSEVKIFDPSGDSTLPTVAKKRKIEEVVEEETEVKIKAKKIKLEPKEQANAEEGEVVKKKKKKKEKKHRAEEEAALAEEPCTSTEVESSEKKKKKKKIKEQDD